jgi:xanthine dehydrogenase large subunit
MSAGRPMPHDAPGCMSPAPRAISTTSPRRRALPAPRLRHLRDRMGGSCRWTSTDVRAAARRRGLSDRRRPRPGRDVSPSAHDEPLLADGRGALPRPAGVPRRRRPRTAPPAGGHARRLDRDRETPAARHHRRGAGGGKLHRRRPDHLDEGRCRGGARRGPQGDRGRDRDRRAGAFLPRRPGRAGGAGRGGEMLSTSSTQHPTEIQHKVAEALGLPMHSVRVETRRMGGGFGGKESQGNALAVACAVAAPGPGGPARCATTATTTWHHRQAARFPHQVPRGLHPGGPAHRVSTSPTTSARAGRQDLTLPVADRAMLHADNAYFVPNMRIESHRLRTNTASATAFRGFGGPQGMLGIERVMDHIAHATGQGPAGDPAEELLRAPATENASAAPIRRRPRADHGLRPWWWTDFVLHEMVEAASDQRRLRRAPAGGWPKWNADSTRSSRRASR